MHWQIFVGATRKNQGEGLIPSLGAASGAESQR